MGTIDDGGSLIQMEGPKDSRSGAEGVLLEIEWTSFQPPPYECRVLIMPEVDGYSVWMPDLPGVASQGDTMEEAIGNLKEAFRGAVSVYRESGDSIPWTTEIEEKAADVVERWILIDA